MMCQRPSCSPRPGVGLGSERGRATGVSLGAALSGIPNGRLWPLLYLARPGSCPEHVTCCSRGLQSAYVCTRGSASARKADGPRPRSSSSLLWMSLSPSQPLGGHTALAPCAEGRVRGFGAIKLAIYTQHSREKATPSTRMSRHSGSWGPELTRDRGWWVGVCT